MARAHLQNRVLPTGEIVSAPFRGAFTGNRGILTFDEHGRLGTSRWKHQHWIICELIHPRGRYHGPQPARAWTPLFFLDEAIALAAGHRPCAYCRPKAYQAWLDAWARAYGQRPGHKEMDAVLHSARTTRNRVQVRHHALLNDLPNHVFVLVEGRSHRMLNGSLFPYEKGCYGAGVPLEDFGSAPVTVLTPAPSVAVLAAGYKVETSLSDEA
ncbi:hypothetical protein [uncultured Roseibium sp.]|uniref:hypothetical protein n=1 Tax=uncultured Roseibium sp. TaxID=1936171 RepID=UPI002610BE08|nr:hypothetical protein [uncultured Roseibium sp.]